MTLLKNRILNKRAFTFVEILLAIFIIGVGVLPVLTMFLTGTRAVESGGLIFQVAVIAQNLMDTVRSDSFMWNRHLKIPKELIEKYKAVANIKIDTAKNHTVLGTGEPEQNLYQIDIVIEWVENGIKRNYSVTNYRANTNSQNMKTSTRF